MSVLRLAYLGANATDLESWRKYNTEVLGLEIGRDSSERLLYLRYDDRHHRLCLHAADNDDIAYVGWEVANNAALDAMASNLERRGIAVQSGTANEMADRRVLGLIHFKCPYTGVRMEFAFGHEGVFIPRFRPTRDLSGFLTGELGMGHVVLYTAPTDVKPAAKFYVDTLGMGISDFVVTQDGTEVAAFLHCNPRHHSLALFGSAKAPRKLQHVFLETNSIDDVGTTYDVCLERELAATSIGRHPDDRSVSFYFRNPSNWYFEYGWQLRTIDPQKHATEQYVIGPGRTGAWGHAGIWKMA